MSLLSVPALGSLRAAVPVAPGGGGAGARGPALCVLGADAAGALAAVAAAPASAAAAAALTVAAHAAAGAVPSRRGRPFSLPFLSSGSLLPDAIFLLRFGSFVLHF